MVLQMLIGMIDLSIINLTNCPNKGSRYYRDWVGTPKYIDTAPFTTLLMTYRIIRILILFVVFSYFEPQAQIVHEVFRAYPGIANNWISGTEKINDSTYLLQEYVSVQTPNGLQIQTALVKVDKNWQQIDSVVIPEMYMLLLKQKDGLIYWVGNRVCIRLTLYCLF